MDQLFESIVVPVASEEDASVTCTALKPYLSPKTDVTVIYVIEKAGGGIDPVPVEHQKSRAKRFFEQCSQELADSAGHVDSRVVFHTDVVEEIFEAASDIGADVIVFTPRSGNRLLKFVTGDTAVRLIHEARQPVLVVPPSDRAAPDQA